jgi:hypothetical protein
LCSSAAWSWSDELLVLVSVFGFQRVHRRRGRCRRLDLLLLLLRLLHCCLRLFTRQEEKKKKERKKESKDAGCLLLSFIPLFFLFCFVDVCCAQLFSVFARTSARAGPSSEPLERVAARTRPGGSLRQPE